MNDDYQLTSGASLNATLTYTAQDKLKYRCPVHGITTRNDLFGYGIDKTPHIKVMVGPEEKRGNYCLLCYIDWLHATFPKLEELE